MLKLSRIGVVLALALLPVWGAAPVQARPAKWPVYPSLFFASDICSVSNNYVVCRPGGLMQSQINSGYECNEVDVVETGYGSGPINLTMSVDDQSQSQTISINDNGTYFIQFPGFLVNNLVSLEFSMPDGASFGLPTIYSTPCPVATKTPTPMPTGTPNPSDTPTPIPNTNTPGPSPTITRIPTHTPLPSGHSTFTPTATATGLPTNTPAPSGERDCGDAYITVHNCDFQPGMDPSHDQTYWSETGTGAGCPYENGIYYYNNTVSGIHYGADFIVSSCSGNVTVSATQSTTAGATGSVHVDIDHIFLGAFSPNCIGVTVADVTSNTAATQDICPGTVGDYAVLNVNQGDALNLTVARTDGPTGSSAGEQPFNLLSFSMVPSGPTGTPTNTPLVTGTIPATMTPLPNPFGTASPIPSDTPCPSGCAVAALTTVPGFSTVVTIDTSPFSPLTHLSLGRSPCTPFGYVQIPYPVITGTPVMGQPLQFAWTVPVTHTWDDTHIITNTAIQPCAMVGEISPYVWDFTYWGSGFGLFVVFTLWLIGWIGRLSGDHTIDG